MRIGELARRTGVTPRSLRYYEQQGLIDPVRDTNGYRRYTEADLVRVRSVQALLAAGLTVTDVHAYRVAGCLDALPGERPACPAELETARRRLARVEDRLAELGRLRDQVARHHADIAEALSAARSGASAARSGESGDRSASRPAGFRGVADEA